LKLALGTAQFGADYGIASAPGRPSIADVKNILSLAGKSGIDTLDTAAAYGNSEEVLGKVGVANWRVVTKIPRFNIPPANIRSWVLNYVQNSLETLDVDSMFGLLLHDASALLKPGGSELVQALLEVKGAGLVDNIGYSIYSPEDLPSLVNALHPDLIQAPLNIFDQRIIRTGWLKRLASEGIEVHVRSIFLQGLLLMEPNSRPSYFGEWAHLFGIWDRLIDRLGVSRTAACIGFINQHADISQAIVGIDNINQLEQILEAARQPVVIDIDGICSDDSGLIDPFNWKI
jgi:aryl-alcohol dehydrogenase-like predicted oxidoreductase